MRIATFNCENLFFRYKFKENKKPNVTDGVLLNTVAYDFFDEEEKALTAAAIDEVNADVLILQEVESLRLLDKFDSELLKKTEYNYKVIIDGRDPRRINVAMISRYPIVSARTHRNERSSIYNNKWLFSRDCLETEIDIDGKSLIVYSNHFKSMLDKKGKTDAEKRANTKPKRLEQATRVAELIDKRWKEKNYIGNYVIAGDLNDYSGKGTALGPLLNHPGLVNVVERLPLEEQWTNYYAGKNKYSQLDYILLSKSLAELNQNKPGIMRKGLPKKAKKYTGERFETIGNNKPKASDHAPVYMDVELE